MADERCKRCGEPAIWNLHNTELWCTDDECERRAQEREKDYITLDGISGSAGIYRDLYTGSLMLPDPWFAPSGSFDLGGSVKAWSDIWLDENQDVITINGVDYRFVSGSLEKI